jgi:hypothetical protein
MSVPDIEGCLSDLAARGIEIDALFLAILSTRQKRGRIVDAKGQLVQAAPKLVVALNKYTNSSDFSTSLLECTVDICNRDNIRTAGLFDSLVSRCSTPALITRIHAVAREECRIELAYLTERRCGLHFNATNASPEQIDAFSLPEIRQNMKRRAPNVYKMMAILLDARKSSRRVADPLAAGDEDDDNEPVSIAQALEANPDLESDTEYTYSSDSDASDHEGEQPPVAPLNKRRQRAVTRRDKLLKIVSVCHNVIEVTYLSIETYRDYLYIGTIVECKSQQASKPRRDIPDFHGHIRAHDANHGTHGDIYSRPDS